MEHPEGQYEEMRGLRCPRNEDNAANDSGAHTPRTIKKHYGK